MQTTKISLLEQENNLKTMKHSRRSPLLPDELQPKHTGRVKHKEKKPQGYGERKQSEPSVE